MCGICKAKSRYSPPVNDGKLHSRCCVPTSKVKLKEVTNECGSGTQPAFLGYTWLIFLPLYFKTLWFLALPSAGSFRTVQLPVSDSIFNYSDPFVFDNYLAGRAREAIFSRRDEQVSLETRLMRGRWQGRRVPTNTARVIRHSPKVGHPRLGSAFRGKTRMRKAEGDIDDLLTAVCNSSQLRCRSKTDSSRASIMPLG